MTSSINSIKCWMKISYRKILVFFSSPSLNLNTISLPTFVSRRNLGGLFAWAVDKHSTTITAKWIIMVSLSYVFNAFIHYLILSILKWFQLLCWRSLKLLGHIAQHLHCLVDRILLSAVSHRRNRGVTTLNHCFLNSSSKSHTYPQNSHQYHQPDLKTEPINSGLKLEDL